MKFEEKIYNKMDKLSIQQCKIEKFKEKLTAGEKKCKSRLVKLTDQEYTV